LFRELVARESEDGHSVIVVVKRTQTCVLRSETSITRDVDDQADLALELVEGNLITCYRGHLEVVEV
jgi:hypothetical protein